MPIGSSKKIAALRIFDDENGVMNRNVVDVDGQVLVVSQFTLMASYKKGNRPSYIRAARPEVAVPLYEYFVEQMAKTIGKPVETAFSAPTCKFLYSTTAL